LEIRQDHSRRADKKRAGKMTYLKTGQHIEHDQI
jgi:hypothetical protein